eukprot:7201466-Prymnesium_polylepis.1
MRKELLSAVTLHRVRLAPPRPPPLGGAAAAASAKYERLRSTCARLHSTPRSSRSQPICAATDRSAARAATARAATLVFSK